MRRGEVWTATRAGHDRQVVIVGHDALTDNRDGVLVVPLSDVRSPTLIDPIQEDYDGKPVGVAMTPRVGEIAKAYLTVHAATLAPASAESLDIALRAVFDL